MTEVYNYPGENGEVQERLLQMPEHNSQTSTSEEDEEDDIISNTIGKYGKWQFLLTFLLALVNIPCTWHIFAPTFQARDMKLTCERPSGISCQTNDSCRVSLESIGNSSCSVDSNITFVKCEKWRPLEDGDTIISEFGLICDRKHLKDTAETIFLGGVALGGLVSGMISDKYGRKRTLFASIFLQTTIGTAIAFAPCYELFVALRCILGFVSVSVVFSGFVLSIELVGGHWRTISGISYLFPVSIGYCTIAGIAYMLRGWRQLQIAVSLPGAAFLCLWWFIPESPRWLLALGKTKEVIQILEQAAKFNNKPLPANLEKSLVPAQTVDQTENQKVGVLDLFKRTDMRKKTLILFLVWFGVYLVYYGLVLNISNIGGDIYVNSCLTGLVEVPAVALSILILIKGGRKWPLALTMILSGIFASLAIPVISFSDDMQWLVTTFAMTSKFCISSSNVIMPVYTAELYPTIIRNLGVGAANMPAGVALMLVPFLFNLQDMHKSLPLLVITIVGVIGGASVLFLPDTGTETLSDTLDSNQAPRKSTASSNGDVKKINNNHTV